MEIPYTLVRSDRKTLSLQIKSDGTLVVRCPRRYPSQEVQRFVESKSSWILRNLQKLAAVRQVPPLGDEELEDLRRKAKEVFPRRAAFYAPKVGVDYGTITVRCQKSRWGSCSSQGNLNFNLLLMLAPLEVLDYVVVHELCHRKEMNHSPAFWHQVERVLPDYRVRKQWLKNNGGAILARRFSNE